MFGLKVQVVIVVALAAVAVGVSPANAVQPECQVVNLPPKRASYNSNTHANPLGAAIADAEEGDTLQVIGTCTGNFVIPKHLTLTGRSSEQQEDTIRGAGGAPVLRAPEVHLTVRYLTLAGVSAQYGGSSGIMSYGTGSSLTVDHVRVTGHTGNGIFSAYGSVAMIDNSIISDNRGIYGTGINTDTDMTIRNSVISGNASGGNGGGIFARGRLAIEHSVIEDNEASRYGGGIYLTVRVAPANSLTVIDSTISGNSAGLGGGGVAVDPYGGLVATAYLANTAVTGNTAPSGGGIYNIGTLTVDNSTVRGNVAPIGGGGIYQAYGGTATIDDSSVSQNVSIYYGGGITSSGTLAVHNSVIEGNAGTGIWSGSGQLTLDQTTVSRNGGGGISNNYGTVTATDSLVTLNSGGGIYTKGTLTLINSAVTANVSSGNGGGVTITLGRVTLTDSTVSGNTASIGGGIWKTSTSILELNGTSSVSGNTPDDIYTSS